MRNAENLVHIPLKLLKASKRYNVRKSKHTARDIAVLADAIYAEGQGNPLDVVVEIRVQGKGAQRRQVETGLYEVAAGRGRLEAMQLLVKDGRWTEDAEALCHIIPAEAALSISLSENTARAPMHPADEFEAFKALIDEGRTVDEVAARYHVSETVVRQRLRLACVATEFIAAYRKDEMELSVLMALTLTDNHEEQRNAVAACKDRLSAYRVRELLTKGEVERNHRLVRFVGEKAYVAAGGIVRSDLFGEDSFYDRTLLAQLADAKIERARQKELSHGAAWVDVLPEPSHRPMADYVKLRAKATANERELAGSVLNLSPDGKLEIFTDVLRVKDARRLEKAKSKKATASAPSADSVHSDSMCHRLSLHRTFALQAEITTRPDVALAALVAELVRSVFDVEQAACGVSVKGDVVGVRRDEAEFGTSAAVSYLGDLHDRWQALLESIPGELTLVDWLLTQPQATVLDLMAFCVARRTSAVVHSATSSSDSDVLAKAVALDMRKWWHATAQGYFSALPKRTIAGVIGDLTGRAVDADKIGKAELAALAESAVAEQGNNWLPEPLRLA